MSAAKTQAALLIVLLLCGSAAAQQGPPTLEVEKTCASAGKAQPGIDERARIEECLRSERSAQDTLESRWGDFSAEAKRRCSRQSQAGGFPSYVETLTCLELASGVPPLTPGGGRSSAAEPVRPEGNRRTEEPLPRLRTDPIEVLENKDGR